MLALPNRHFSIYILPLLDRLMVRSSTEDWEPGSSFSLFNKAQGVSYDLRISKFRKHRAFR